MADPIEQTANATKAAGSKILSVSWKIATGAAMSLGAAFAIAHTGGLAAPLNESIIANVGSLYSEAFTDVKDLIIS